MSAGFERLRGRALEPEVEVRAPLEVTLVVTRVDLCPQRLVGMEVGMPLAPLRQMRRALGRPPCRDEHPVLRLVPVDRAARPCGSTRTRRG